MNALMFTLQQLFNGDLPKYDRPRGPRLKLTASRFCRIEYADGPIVGGQLRARNLPCVCGSGLKFKRCCMKLAQNDGGNPRMVPVREISNTAIGRAGATCGDLLRVQGL